MEDSSLKTVLATPEETEEPYPKKFKIDSNQVIFEKGQQQLFEKCSEDKKSANKFLCFPKILWNFSQHNLELREKSSTNLKTNIRQHANFKMYMNANLQSRLLENIPYIEKWHPNSCTRNGSCKLKKNNSDFIKLESLVSYAKESETATKTANMSKTNEWPRGIIFYIILAEKFIARIESLFGDVPEFQNKEKDPGCCRVCKMLRSEEQHLISKPVRSDENSDDEVLKFCLPFKYFMNGKKSDFESLNYEYNNILYKNSDILSYKKQKRFSGKKNFRRNKIFRHTYTLYSKKCGINLKLTKGIAFELFLQSKGTYRYSTVTENGIPVLQYISQINQQQTEKSNEEDTKEWLLCPTDIREDDIFSMLCYGKKQTSQIILSNNQNIQSKKCNIILWERIFLKQFLYIPETIYNLADSFRLLNYLILIPIILKKSKAKDFKLEIVTVEPFIQNKYRKSNQTSGFSSKKFKHSYFVLRAHNKWEKRIFRNSINCTNNKYVPKYIETDSKERMNKTQYNNHKHNQNNSCDFVDRKSHLDTYTKISLSSYSEEIEHISVLGEVIITDEKYSKRCITADKGFTRNHSETLTYICAPLKLCANDSCLLKQERKSKTYQYFKDRQWLKHKINGKFFPISKRLFKHSLHVNQYFTPDMFHKLCLTQNMAISVETKQSKTSLYGKRCFGFEKIKSVLQYQYQTTWISNVFKAPKTNAMENKNFLGSYNILFSGTIMSEILCINQTAEDVNKTKCAIAEKNYVNKRNQSQNLCELDFKEECAKSVNSVDKLTASCSTKQKGFEDSREGHFSSETNRRDQFKLVLEELHMFNEISKENENSLSQTEVNILEKESHVLNCSDNIPDQVNRNINPVISTTDITMSCTSGIKQNSYKNSLFKQNIQFGEQEIPHSSNLSGEELFCSSSEKCAHRKQPFSWKPAFVSQTFMKEGSCNLTSERGNCLLSGIIRIQPLKTCCGPLRVGLSRKAKLKQLHPYLK
ncbi:RAD51-associated protein 2 [Pantherophis guttatus]|uniref:RAD51-associated protein 2 n=1 Tax=Pantherophis guttatus TaxID=94885 RepID=A0A6P9CXN7_PANGU|nr:RAD51-associated protein 2 [Pantherophis guttatus]XP_034288034.1 RAD51-associated protein 2 [Pantherophis guttatus]XP_034288035.1 RAD51-associated protein 2 [Pantherophis guttatus]XP_060545280.1 RAD51-associated protein 2 [Pantherophis guttatus]